MLSILLHCPLHSAYPRLYAKALTSLFDQEWPEPYELVFGVSKDAADGELDHIGKVERARRMAIDGDYDGLLVVDYDVQVPSNALVRLDAVQVPVVCAITVDRVWPHRWQMSNDSGCILYRREALAADDWRTIAQPICIDDLYCTRLTMADGGKAIVPSKENPDGISMLYFDPARAPATVPYSRTILSREPA